MRIWNLNEPINLADDVLETAQGPHPRRRRAHFLARRPTSLRLLAGIASLAVTVTVGTAIVNRDVIRLPNWETAVSKSAPELRGPLDHMFRDRFSAEWSDALEASLLNEIVENRLLRQKSQPEPADIADFIYSNQQENIVLDTPRLNRVTIERIVKERKTS
jgi:hypothetical protein